MHFRVVFDAFLVRNKNDVCRDRCNRVRRIRLPLLTHIILLYVLHYPLVTIPRYSRFAYRDFPFDRVLIATE